MTPAFWKGKRVLITGHTGFKGAWLSLWLQELGAKVSGYALESPTRPNLFQVARVEEGMTSHIADIRSLASLESVFAQHSPEIVFHMAAQPLVRESYIDPIETFSTNIMGTVNVLEVLRKNQNVRVFVNITTDKCYENREWHWGYRENEPLGGKDPYSSSKACSEMVTAAYRASFFSASGKSSIPTVIASARAGNVIGGGDWARDRLIPDVIRGFMEKTPVVIRNPESIRPWQFVLEPLHGYLILAEKAWEGGGRFSEGWNFGPCDEDARPVRWIVERMAGLWGEGAVWDIDSSDHPPEARYLKLDCSKAKSDLSWNPKLRLGTALEWITTWFRAFQSGEEMRPLTVSQIQSFQALERHE